MAFFDNILGNKKVNGADENGIVNINYTPSLSSDFLRLAENFKGEVKQNKVKFPNDLGEEHPFDFATLEALYKKFGFFSAIVDKYIDFIVGPGFYVVSDNEKAKEIIENFMKDVNFDTLLRGWTKEALVKGNGYLEIGGEKDKGVKGLKILNANYMYVDRDKLGKILGYKQYRGEFDKFAKKKITDFKVDQIAHVPFNVVGDCAYGLGIGYPAMSLMNNLLQESFDLHKIMSRKANSPLHAKLGKVDGNVHIIPKSSDVTAFGKKMENMKNKTDWATDDLVELSVVDFGNFGDKFSAILDYDLEMLIYALQIPAVILGKANVPEGLARVQMEAFQRRIQSIQAELEKIIENKIFKRVLNANGFDDDVEFEWGTPSIMEVEGRLQLITTMINSSTASYAMKEILEEELINLLKLDKDRWEELKVEEEEERKREEERSQPIIPGQNAKFPQRPPAKTKPASQPVRPPRPSVQDATPDIKEKRKKPNNKLKHSYELEKPCSHCEEGWGDINDINEWLGFKYQDYIKQILLSVSAYGYDFLKAESANELAAGYLTAEQIGKLKGVLEDGFKKGKSLRFMAKEVDKKVGLKDLYRMTETGAIKKGVAGFPILQKAKENRAITIVRTEVTRAANAGAIATYKEKGVEKVRWVASYGARTCPDCESLDGTIYNIGTEIEMPRHVMCRCAYVPVEGII